MTTPSERYLVAKELAAALIAAGIRISTSYARSIIRDCPQSVRRELRLADAITFLRTTPDYRPRARRDLGLSV